MTEREVALWLRERDDFLILTHIRPDGDTLGSAAGLCAALRLCGKRAWVAENKGVTATYLGDIQSYFAPADFVPQHIVAVDIATEGLFPPEFECYRGKAELCVDHHPSNTRYAPNLCLDADAAACGEVIYRICRELGVMDEAIAKALYLAISTDCGGFIYSNTTSVTHRTVADLMEYGTFWKEINKRCFQTKSRKRLQMEARLMASEQFFDEGRICIGTVTMADRAEVGADESDCEELSAFAPQIEGVLCAATIRELSPGVCKVSLRTNPDYANANHICAHMGGGGHAAASGATLRACTIEQAREQVYQAICTEVRF